MIKEVNTEEFNEIYGTGLTLADFYSKTCGPCKMLAFVLKDVEKVHPDVNILKIDFDESKDLTAAYEVEGYPTIILFKDGVEVKRMKGLQQKPAIIKMIEENKE